MTLPLTGMLVVALEQAVAAPTCTCRLADAGARVIKIERPEGDFARHYDDVVHGESAYFIWLNRGKESVVLDLAQEADKALMERLLALPGYSYSETLFAAPYVCARFPFDLDPLAHVVAVKAAVPAVAADEDGLKRY